MASGVGPPLGNIQPQSQFCVNTTSVSVAEVMCGVVTLVHTELSRSG